MTASILPFRERVDRAEIRALLLLAGPLIAQRAGHNLMSMVDTFMASRISPGAVAAVGMASATYFSLFIFAIGVILGADPIVSQAVGARDEARWRAAFVAQRWIAVLISLPIIAGVLATPFLLERLGFEAELVEGTGKYLYVLALGIVPMSLATAYSVYLTAHGHSKQFLVVTIVGNIANVGMNAWFIAGGFGLPAMGVAGIALSTSLSSVLELAMIRWWMRAGSPLGAVHVPWGSPDPAMVREILAVGTPIAGQYFLEVAGFSVAAMMLGWIGSEYIAGHQIAISIASMTFSVALGIGMAGSVRVGQAVGRRDLAGVERAGTTTLAVAVGWALVTAAGMAAFRVPLAELYTDEPSTILIASSFIAVAALFQIADCTQAAGFGVLRGLADTRVPGLINLVAYWVVGLPAGWYLAFHTSVGPLGIWYALTVALFIVSISLMLRFRHMLARGEGYLAALPTEPPALH